jgi:hypothetical protein
VATPFFPLAGCQASGLETQTALAASFCRLFKTGFVPDASTPRADYLTNEADYTGYTAGGEPIAAWNDPILAPGSGFQMGSPLVQFDTADPTTVGNVIGGAWVEDAAGIIRMTVIFDAPVSMDAPFQGIPINWIWPFPSGQ